MNKDNFSTQILKKCYFNLCFYYFNYNDIKFI